MIVSSKTNYNKQDVYYGDRPLDKAELCLRQFKAYVCWAKGCPKDHETYKTVLRLARQCYDLYKIHKYDDLVLAYERHLDYNELEVTEVKEIG